MPIRDAVRGFPASLKQYLEDLESGQALDAKGFLDQGFRYYPFTPQAQDWLRAHICAQVLEPYSTACAGNGFPDRRLVR